MKPFFLEKILLPIADKVSRQHVMAAYRFFKQSQWWETNRLVDLQEKRLRETIRIAYEQVPFYHEHFERQGIKPKDIVGLSDISRIQPVSKHDLRQAYPGSCVRRSGTPVQQFYTSGSSGQPFAVMVDNITLSHARALMLLRANYSGWEIGEPVLQTGMSLNRGFVKRAKDLLLEVHYVSAFDLTDPILDRYLELIDKHRLKYIMGYPGSIYFLARRARQNSFNRRLKGIVSWGDNLYRHYRLEIEEVFGCRVTDTYGCGEGIQVAAQCQEGNYHIFMPHVLVEVVDEDGQPKPPGSRGTILLTRLNAGAMPLIRYRVGDQGRIGALNKCPCGRGLVCMEAIEGRDTDIIITPRGNRLIVHFFTGIFEYYPSIDTFKVVQERLGAIRVEIVPRQNFKLEHWYRIRDEILQKGDPDLKIEMDVVENISTEPSNKRRFVVSKLSKTHGITH